MSARGRLAVLATVVVAVLLASWLSLGRGGGAPSSATLPEAGSRFGGVAQASTGPPAAPPANSVAARRAAGLIVAGFAGTTADAPGAQRAAERGWGGVLLQDGNGLAPKRLRGLTGGLTAAAGAAGHSVPLVVAAPEVAGALGRLPAQSAVADPAKARASAERAGRLLKQTGIGLALDPSADLGWAGGAWAEAAFADDPSVVARAAVATVDGWRAGGVRAVAGHFPGEGGASGDPSLGPATVGLALADLRRADLRPFQALAASAPAIQMSAALYAAFDGVTPASILPSAVRLLRSTGFRGAIMSADLTAVAAASGGSVADAAVDALRAGCDLALIPGDAADQDAAWHAVAAAIASGRLPASRVRDAEAHVAALRLAG